MIYKTKTKKFYSERIGYSVETEDFDLSQFEFSNQDFKNAVVELMKKYGQEKVTPWGFNGVQVEDSNGNQFGYTFLNIEKKFSQERTRL